MSCQNTKKPNQPDRFKYQSSYSASIPSLNNNCLPIIKELVSPKYPGCALFYLRQLPLNNKQIPSLRKHVVECCTMFIVLDSDTEVTKKTIYTEVNTIMLKCDLPPWQ